MALFIADTGPAFDPPAIVREAGADLLRNPLTDLLDSFQQSTPYTDKEAFISPFPISHWASGSSGPFVNSVQEVSITIATSATTGTAAISAVGSLAFIIPQGWTSNDTSTYGTGGAGFCGRVDLTSTTQITATRGLADASFTTTVNCIVIDPTSSLVQSVQQGTVALSNVSTNTGSITSVDLTRSFIVYLGMSMDDTTSNARRAVGKTVLTSATVVTCSVNQSISVGKTATFGYVVVQLQAAACQSVQQFSLSVEADASLTYDQTISAVVTANTLIIWNGQLCDGTNWNNLACYLSLTSTTNVRATRQGSGASGTLGAMQFFVVEFKTGVLKSMQRGQIALASVASNTATISAVTTSKTAVNYLGSDASTSGVTNVMMHKDTLTSSTVITATRNTAGAVTCNISYEAAEFN